MGRMRDQTATAMQPLKPKAQSQHGPSALERQDTKGKELEAHMPRSEELDETHRIDADIQPIPPQYVGSGFIPHAYL